MNVKILLLGGGNMARAIVIGLIVNGYNPKQIYLVDRNEHKRKYFSDELKVHVSENVEDFLPIADVIFLAVKPQGAKDLCTQLQPNLQQQNPLIISVMAGITTEKLAAWMGPHLSIVRAAPNTPALIQAGATGLFANQKANSTQKEIVENLMQSIGITAWLPQEDNINAITALSGSGPAYYFYFIEIMQAAAVKMGVPAEIAKNFAIQTALGAAKLALASNEDVIQLRAQVTSKKGTTEAAIKTMQEAGIASILEKALSAAYNRALELSEGTH